MQEVDAVLTLQRPGCVARQQEHKKMWMHHIDHFPALQWHAQITKQLSQFHGAANAPMQANCTIRIGYIDRQNTGRRLPAKFHDFLVSFLTGITKEQPSIDDSNVSVEFLHLHMEHLSPLQQILTASTLDLLIGVHGNGLSHLFFLPPGSAVLELFWDSTFQFDYATGAQMMGHDYLCLYNGLPVSSSRIVNRDVQLKRDLSLASSLPSSSLVRTGQDHGDTSFDTESARIAVGTRIAAQFVDDTVARLRQERRLADNQQEVR